MSANLDDIFQWTEEWWAPGLCLLGRSRVVLKASAKRRGGCPPSGIWLLVHGNKAMLLDAPFATEDADAILDRIERHLTGLGLELMFFTASHLHMGHAAGLERIAERFPVATFVFPRAWPEHYKRLTFDSLVACARLAGSLLWERGARIQYGNEAWIDLDGEPLILMHAPYHSPTDQLVIFRGVALTPDWHLPLDIREEHTTLMVSAEEAASTVGRLLALQQHYVVHSFVNVHADWSLRNDFVARLHTAMGWLRGK